MLSFNDIIGNKQIIKSLQSAINSGKVSHAYIFSGIMGVGKMLLAETFTQALQCEASTGCGVCVGCKTVSNHNNPDVFYVKAAKTKAIGADDIREQVLKNIETKQYKYKYKVFIIEDADKMTVAAQNVLLKTLEEPPAYAVFLLLAENVDLFLPTVVSRCVNLKIQPLTQGQVENYLEKEDIEKDVISFLSQYAGGSIGKALLLGKDADFFQMRNDVIEKLSTITEKDLATVITWGKDLERYKENIGQVLDVCYLWFRDVLVAKKIKDKKYIIQKDKENKIISLAERLSFDTIGKSLDAVWQARRALEQNGNFQLTMEIMLMSIKGV